MGNIDLKNERGDNSDAGLVYRGTGILSLAEIAYYRNSVDDLIRFMHNSQSVSRALNVGRAQLSGVETRLQTRPLAWARIDFNYTYQRAENRSGFAYERGNELPNAPRQALEARLNIEQGRHSAHYAFSRESRHYLDRANLRPVPRRLVHGLGGRIVLNTRTALNWEVRNLTDNQAADLWGYPLPGRALFLSIKHNLFTP
jgi:outer membrane cobalamin receptor